MRFHPALFNQNFGGSSGPSAYDLAVFALSPTVFLEDLVGPIGNYPTYDERVTALSPTAWLEDAISDVSTLPEFDSLVVSTGAVTYVPGDQVIPD